MKPVRKNLLKIESSQVNFLRQPVELLISKLDKQLPVYKPISHYTSYVTTYEPSFVLKLAG
jgi:hypothetical protein